MVKYKISVEQENSVEVRTSIESDSGSLSLGRGKRIRSGSHIGYVQ